MSIITERYYRGINLGGWLSQCPNRTEDHYETYITEEDIKTIKEAGFDHVRVPFDYDLLEQDSKPYVYSEEGLQHIKRALKWCKEYGLNMILDLHKAPGYSFDTLQENQLFVDETLQNRMIKLWVYLVEEFKGYDDSLIIELLNEIVEPDSTRWNKLATAVIHAIREVDDQRYILVGGNNYNATSELKNLDLPEDPRIIYNFHFYEPLFVTHQKASWSQRMVDYNRNLEYPGHYIEMEAFLKAHPEHKGLEHLLEENLDLAAIKKYLEPALEFVKEKQVPLYCGEFGVIALASMATRENWHRDFMSLLNEYHIGSAVWSYKNMDFEIFKDRKPVSEELVKILTQR